MAIDMRNVFTLGLITGLVTASVLGVAWNFFMGMEYEDYRCFSVASEKNLSSFNLQGLKAECHPDALVRLCRVNDIYQIGGKAANGPMLVVAWTRTFSNEVMNNVTWEGLEQVDCPENVENLREEIRDETVYESGNV